MVEYLVEYIVVLKLEKVYLVGYFLGGWIVVSYGFKYLDKLLGLILVFFEGIDIVDVKVCW